MNKRINIKIGAEFGELHAHLSQYGVVKGERFKVLASIGSLVEDAGLEFPVGGPSSQEEVETDWNGRVNIRLSNAYPELQSKLIDPKQSKAGRLKLLANLGLLAMRGGCIPSNAKDASVTEKLEKVAAASACDFSRIEIAAGMFGDEETKWL